MGPETLQSLAAHLTHARLGDAQHTTDCPQRQSLTIVEANHHFVPDRQQLDSLPQRRIPRLLLDDTRDIASGVARERLGKPIAVVELIY